MGWCAKLPFMRNFQALIVQKLLFSFFRKLEAQEKGKIRWLNLLMNAELLCLFASRVHQISLVEHIFFKKKKIAPSPNF
jgi:hypothetical protein